MKHQFKLLSVGIVLTSTIVLSACSHNIPQPVYTPYHPLTSAQKTWASRMRSAGIQVMKQGDVVALIIPTDRFFVPQTTTLKRSRLYAMSAVAKFVHSYSRSLSSPSIQVAGYTDTVFARKTARSLSKQYATVIASYLWSHGVPNRRMSIRGYGAQYPIATNRTPRGSAYNRRVEIRIQD